MTQTVQVSELMATSGVKFGTSGARGLVHDMTDQVCFAYTAAFLQHLRAEQRIATGTQVALAGDLRPSTGRILQAVRRAVLDGGYRPVCCGRVPSPAVALLGLQRRIPAIMVTGSHIPDDRNGIKFNAPEGEILKRDEAGIQACAVQLPAIFDEDGMLRSDEVPPAQPVDETAARGYVARWVEAFAPDALDGMRVGLYAHSAVGRDLIHQVLEGLGAKVTRLGDSNRFIPVDTEAIRHEDVQAAAQWAGEHELEAIVSTDGDSDRPLVSDERGRWLRGDVAGILCARYLGADVVVTPVSCNSAVERCGWFRKVVRTRIGSPFVIEAMQAAMGDGGRVVGYEANGGFLTGSPIALARGVLAPLPTRDPVIVMLSVLCGCRDRGLSVSQLLEELPRRFTASDRLRDFPTDRSQEMLSALERGGSPRIEQAFEQRLGPVLDINKMDGLRVTFESGEVVHMRPSGNAPELRCYTEAATEARAIALNAEALAVMARWR